METSNILSKLIARQDLSSTDTQDILEGIMNEEITPAQTGALLTALSMKGETPAEIVGFIQGMRKHMVKVVMKDAIDVCGTGGDNSGTINISTAVALVVTGAGVKVAKHGNRAASSKSGSADVLESLGVNIQLKPKDAEEVFNKTGIVFLFAPLYHPATKNVVAVRKELKVRTVFNFLGPFVNPASLERQFIGVPDQEIAATLAEVAKTLGYKHLLIVTGEDGLDEVSISANTVVLEIKNSEVKKFTINPEDYGIKKVGREKILGGDVEENAQAIQQILRGEKGPKRDIVVLNSAYALYISGKVNSIEEGIKLAEESIDSGNAKHVLENLIKETKKYA